MEVMALWHEGLGTPLQPLVKYLNVMYATEQTATAIKVFFSLDFHTFASSSCLTFLFIFSTRFVSFSFLSSLLRLRTSVELSERKQFKFSDAIECIIMN